MTFIANAGWDRVNGGIWWTTRHDHKAGEALASGTLLAASLYHDTGDPRYLGLAVKFIGWADTSFTDSDGLYKRREDDDTAMPYVEGPMFAAFASLCDRTGDTRWCGRAERLAQVSSRHFPVLRMGPQYDAIYIRCLVELYKLDGDASWYAIAQQNAQRALGGAQDGRGLYLRGWDGGSLEGLGVAPNTLQIHAATSSVFAWMATAPPPALPGL
jgi:uncharacterized protein YyaL (SSP411 family)